MSDLLNVLPWFAVVISLAISNSLFNDKMALEKANERLLNEKTKIESVNENLKDSMVICQSELKGYTNGSK
ncbi:MAG TPA: hypothetical protein V6C58_21175 [Allocoleopsis sp.]